MIWVKSFTKINKVITKVWGIVYVEWTLSLNVSECKESVPYTSVYTSITSYAAALLQKRDVNFDGVSRVNGGGTWGLGKILSYSPITGTITRADSNWCYEA